MKKKCNIKEESVKLCINNFFNSLKY